MAPTPSYADEKRRVFEGPSRDRDVVFGAGVMQCVLEVEREPLGDVLDRIRTLWIAVITGLQLPSVDWEIQLPEWFVESCPSPLSDEQEQAFLALWREAGPEEKLKLEKQRGWSVEDWVYWFTDNPRLWYWWTSRIKKSHVEICFDVTEWPAPTGALQWMFRVSGGTYMGYRWMQDPYL